MGGYWYVDSQPYSAVLDALIAASNSSQIVLTTGTYSDPGFIASLAASKITGTLAKSQQHAQTAYKDEANAWAETQTFSSTIEVNGSGISTRYGVQISELSDGTPQWLLYKNNGSGQALLLRDLVNSRTHASFTPGTTAALARLDLLCNLYGAENLHAEKGLNATINNSWLGFSDGNNYIGGVSNFRPAVGGSATAIINGETGAATFNGTATINKTGSNGLIVNNTLGNALAVFNASAAGVTDNAYLIIQTGGSPRWYVGQSVSSLTGDFEIYGAGFGGSMLTLNRTTGTMTANAATFNGNLQVNGGAATFSSTAKLGDYTVATLPSAASNTGHECNATDSSVTTFGSTVAGGGSNNVKVRSNGTNWTVTGI